MTYKTKVIGDVNPDNSGRNYSEWTLDFLCDYIVNTHHKYVKKTLPDLDEYTAKIASVHGDIHPELLDVADLFKQLKYEFAQHLLKEENVLFPAIKEVLTSGSEEAKKIIKSEIDRMGSEHEFAGGTMDKINRITNGYSLPEGACNTYQVCFQMLSQFEDDLHIHVHLENNILYRKALEL
ncbi:MAG: hemerythrin domain-containing protein [Bacteroidales bacterium]|nr:hemerythrin domain-containing protein [Bacteroidales bacterium]